MWFLSYLPIDVRIVPIIPFLISVITVVVVLVLLLLLLLLVVVVVGSGQAVSYNCRPFRRFSFLAAKIVFVLGIHCASFGLEGRTVATAGP